MDSIGSPDAASTTASPAPTSQPWSFPKRFIAAFNAPRALFEHLAERPTWAAPLLVFLLVTMVAVALLWDPVIVPEQIERLEASGQASDEAIAMISGPMKYVSFLFAALGTIASVLLYALAVFFVGGFLLGGRLNYRQALSLVTHAGLVTIPGALIRIPLAFASKTSQVTLGPGAFFPAADAEGFGGRFLAYFLTSFDVFMLWQTALVALGVGVIGRVASGKASMAIWTLFVVFALGIGLLTAVFQR